MTNVDIWIGNAFCHNHPDCGAWAYLADVYTTNGAERHHSEGCMGHATTELLCLAAATEALSLIEAPVNVRIFTVGKRMPETIEREFAPKTDKASRHEALVWKSYHNYARPHNVAWVEASNTEDHNNIRLCDETAMEAAEEFDEERGIFDDDDALWVGHDRTGGVDMQ